MRVLVVGGGGREHALCWALAASPVCDVLYCAPGNPGIAQEVDECIGIEAEDVDALVAFAGDRGVDLVVVGPEAPLVAGLADKLEAAGIQVFGPSAAAAQLEGSKAFMKTIAEEAGVPTAAHRRFSDYAAARTFVAERGAPVVIKADGLAAGKGVTVAHSQAEAEAALHSMLVERVFGEAGASVVVEECLTGTEASVFALCDGQTVLPFGSAQDHKPIGEGDTGANTGGMGAFSPTPAVDAATETRVHREIIQPMITALARRGNPYVGVFYAGVMLTDQGPKLLEVNVRFGDPECQVLVPRLFSDLLPALVAACDGQLHSFDLRWDDTAALTVVMAADGYPGKYRKGQPIRGLDAVAGREEGLVFHAGTARGDSGEVITAGGRVLSVTGLGADLATARRHAYAVAGQISWDDAYYRRDIGATAAGGA